MSDEALLEVIGGMGPQDHLRDFAASALRSVAVGGGSPYL
jgi:hypothetical protein